MATGLIGNLSGTGYRQIATPRFTPEQQSLFSELLGSSKGGISSSTDFLKNLASGDPNQFSQMEAPAFRQFNEQIGQLSSRFSGQGMGGRRSSGFNNAAGGAAADLAERLQGNRMTLQNQAVKDLLGLYSQLLGNEQYDYGFVPEMLKQKKPKNSFWQSLLGAGAAGLGAYGSKFLPF